MNRSSTTVILAMTADGKIADGMRSPARFSSATDKAHLEKQIALVDGVLFGAGTLRAYGTTLRIVNSQLLHLREQLAKPPQPVHIVCSASGDINPQLQFFSQSIPRWLLTTSSGAQSWQASAKGKFERILIAQTNQQPTTKSIDWMGALTQLSQLGIDKLAILGGGELVASLLAVDLIDEFWLTVCPLILGGETAPTPVEGIGWLMEQAKQLELLSAQKVEQEVFLHYRVQR